MKVFFNRKVRRTPWGGGIHFMNALVDHLIGRGHQVVFDLQNDIDVIFMMDPRYEDGGGYSIKEIAQYKSYHPSTRIIHRINECDARKNTREIDDLLLRSNSIADVTIFISEWLKRYFHDLGLTRESSVIYNGCNTEFFYPDSARRTIQPVKLVTHHWSDNWMKGFDAYKAIDQICQNNPEKFQFTYVGRYSKDYSPTATRIVSPLYGKDLGGELRKHDVYITASRWEPCGMHHIEGAASGLPVLYHRDGGGIPEGCRLHGIEFNSDNLHQKLEEMLSSMDSLRKKIDYSFLSMDRCLQGYTKIIEEKCLG